MSKYLLYFLITMQTALWWGCNSDIFVSRLPELETTVTLSGDNGSEMVRIQKKGLVGVQFDNNVDYSATTVFYNYSGEVMTGNFSVNEVERIRYGGQRFIVDFYMEGDDVKVVAVDNSYPSDIIVWIMLDYGFTTRGVTLEIGPGRQMEIVEMAHVINGEIVDSITLRSMTQRFVNNTPHPLKTAFYPYREVKSRLTLTPSEDWTNGIGGIIPLPTFVNGEWNDFKTDETQVVIGQTAYYTSSNVNTEDETTVELRANSTGTVNLSVTYATLRTKYIAILRLPNSGEIYTTSGEWNQRQPIGYNLEVTYE